MRTLKFRPHLAEQIVRGEKTSTWRLFDDKFIETGDEIEFVNKETLQPFGVGKITWVSLRTLGTLTDEDWVGHERFASEEEMYSTYHSYYPDKEVNKDTVVKVLTFEFTPKQ